MKKSFLVVYEKGRKNYGGFAPDVPGCGSLGFTLEEMRANLQEALQLYIDTSVELGYALPEPTINTITLPIEGKSDPKTTYVVERITATFPRPKLGHSKIPKLKLLRSKHRHPSAALYKQPKHPCPTQP